MLAKPSFVYKRPLASTNIKLLRNLQHDQGCGPHIPHQGAWRGQGLELHAREQASRMQTVQFQWPVQPQVCSGEACSIGEASAQPQAVQRWQQVHPAAPERLQDQQQGRRGVQLGLGEGSRVCQHSLPHARELGVQGLPGEVHEEEDP